MTKRLMKQNAILLINSMLGSVFGIMSAIGGVMAFVEKRLISMKRKRNLNRNHENKARIMRTVIQNKYSFTDTETCRPKPRDSPTYHLVRGSNSPLQSADQHLESSIDVQDINLSEHDDPNLSLEQLSSLSSV